MEINMEQIHSGKDHNIWQLNPKDNGLLEQMLPLECTKIFRRGYEGNIDIHNIGGWDCDCGIYVLGSLPEVEKAFVKIYDWMKLRTDKKIINDLVPSDAVDYLGMFVSKKQDIAIIIGGGYYEDTDEAFLTLLDELKNVTVGEIGANYTNDQDLYRTLLEDIDYINYHKIEKNNLMDIALIDEVFEYWQENDIYTKEDRFNEGLKNVDKVVNKYRKTLLSKKEKNE